MTLRSYLNALARVHEIGITALRQSDSEYHLRRAIRDMKHDWRRNPANGPLCDRLAEAQRQLRVLLKEKKRNGQRL